METSKKHTLEEILIKQKEYDDGLSAVDFDPDMNIEDLAKKIDGYKAVIDAMKYRCKEIMECEIQPAQEKHDSILAEMKGLKKRLAEIMERHSVEKIPGFKYRLQLLDSNPSVDVNVLADAKMYLNYPDLVVQKTTYQWDKEEIKAQIDAGQSFTFAKLKQEHHIQFYKQGMKK